MSPCFALHCLLRAWLELHHCLSGVETVGPLSEECAFEDDNGDGVVDLRDVAEFLNAIDWGD
jgi:hypothetical protein